MKIKDYKELINLIDEIRIKVYSGQSLEETDRDLNDLQMTIFKIQDENNKRTAKNSKSSSV